MEHFSKPEFQKENVNQVSPLLQPNPESSKQLLPYCRVIAQLNISIFLMRPCNCHRVWETVPRLTHSRTLVAFEYNGINER